MKAEARSRTPRKIPMAEGHSDWHGGTGMGQGYGGVVQWGVACLLSNGGMAVSRSEDHLEDGVG